MHILMISRPEAWKSALYREFPPAPDLRAFVACTWVRLVRLNPSASCDLILPDGCADIIVCDDHPPTIAAPDAITRRVQLRDGMVLTGIRLRPGAWHAVFGCPAFQFLNGGTLLSDIAPGARQLHQAVLQASNLAHRLAALEAWTRDALVHATSDDHTIIAACRGLSGPVVAISAVADSLDWNVRTMHRRFLAACGYGPKHFQKIMRIQAVLRAAQAIPSASLAELAIAAGFADQAHMTRDFRAITGLTPADYFRATAPQGWGAWMNEAW
jgi:AraC-like DNA-binding protein